MTRRGYVGETSGARGHYTGELTEPVTGTFPVTGSVNLPVILQCRGGMSRMSTADAGGR